jgi:NTP pyrophosphatase (non-canonical NTP hydrolase)
MDFKQICAINNLVEEIHLNNKSWWINIETNDPIELTKDIILAKIALVHSELSEAVEGVRKDLPDDKLPHRQMVEVELADAVIRIMDLAGALDLDLGGAIAEKIEYNKTRKDHSIEHRLSENGKKV